MTTRMWMLIVVAALALAPSVAAAQGQPNAGAPPTAALQPGQPVAPAPAVPGVRPPAAAAPVARPSAAEAGPRAVAVQSDPRLNPTAPPHLDDIESTGKGMALLFWAFALAAVGGALFVITRRNLIAAVMGMVGSFMGIAAVYMMLYATFLSVIQMLVYAGAIMVLFVFVIMILNRPEDEPVAPTGRIGQAIGAAAMLYLVFRLATLLVDVKAPEEAMRPPDPVVVTVSAQAADGSCDVSRCEARGGKCATVATGKPQVCRVAHDWGSVRAVGTDLFGPGVFPFEAISILLLIAVVGAIAVARPLHEDAKPEADADAGAGAGGHP
jgi:NADH-quinone oxidoreductase subunit J